MNFNIVIEVIVWSNKTDGVHFEVIFTYSKTFARNKDLMYKAFELEEVCFLPHIHGDTSPEVFMEQVFEI